MIRIQCVIGVLVGLLVSCSMSADPTPAPPVVYSGQSTMDGYLKLKILRKPGDCHSHPDYPNTIQCAETDRCISFKQFNDSKCDCCGPDKDCKTCTDQSDENRVAPPGTAVCKDHPHYQYGLVYQCALHRDICLSRLLHWNNGQCDCCPEQKFVCGHPNCTDHSDEECPANEWPMKFSCDGNCIAINKYNDNETDCFSDCTVEGNAVARAGCEAKQKQRTATAVDDFCDMMAQKNTPYFRCTSGDKQCIPSTCVRDKKQDCASGEDENAAISPDCPASVKSSKCDAAATGCVLVNNKSDGADCRCPSAAGDGTLDNCNKDRPNRRRKIF